MSWIEVEDSVPEDGNTMCSSCSNNVLIWTNLCDTNDDASIGWWCYGEKSKRVWNTCEGLDEDEYVTHWMELPKPPTKLGLVT